VIARKGRKGQKLAGGASALARSLWNDRTGEERGRPRWAQTSGQPALWKRGGIQSAAAVKLMRRHRIIAREGGKCTVPPATVVDTVAIGRRGGFRGPEL
jgi:hypothetical protein